jgi:hypothetical protein
MKTNKLLSFILILLIVLAVFMESISHKETSTCKRFGFYVNGSKPGILHRFIFYS